MGSLTKSLVVTAVLVLVPAMINWLVFVAAEARLLRERARCTADQEHAEDDWQEAAHRELFRD